MIDIYEPRPIGNIDSVKPYCFPATMKCSQATLALDVLDEERIER
jgi:hypothetical protein